MDKSKKPEKTDSVSVQVDKIVIPPNYLKESEVREALINFLLDEIKVKNLDSGTIDHFIEKCKAV